MDKLDYCLSDGDIKRFFNNKIKIIKYADLDSMTIYDLLGDYGRCVILFEMQGRNNGHWTILQFMNNKKSKYPYILFTDPYGYKPERQIDYETREWKNSEENKQDRGKLLKILYNSPYSTHFNNHKLQELKRNTNTCGKHCCIRGLFDDINENDYYSILKEFSKENNLSIDFIINAIFNLLNNI
jgi:hypothetical protein